MKTNKLSTIILALAIAATGISCSDGDDTVITHEMGSWILETIADVVDDPNYSWYSGEYTAEELALTFTLNLKEDGTYNSRISQPGTSTQAEQGTWVLDEEGELLTLTNDDEVEEAYTVVQNELDLLKISLPSQAYIISNEDRNDILAMYPTQEEIDAYLESLTEEELALLFPLVDYEVLLSFIRVTE